MGLPLSVGVFYDVSSVDGHDADSGRSLGALSEGALKAAVVGGDASAFEEVVRRYRNDVYRLAYHFLRNREDAWDVSQEVFVKAFRGLKRFRGDASMKTWLMRITSNHCKDYFKKRRLQTVSFEEVGGQDSLAGGSGPGPDGVVSGRETGAAIVSALSGLSVKHRTAFVLREFEGLAYEEMASVMGCSVGTVMSRLFHARRKLQGALIRMGVVEDCEHE